MNKSFRTFIQLIILIGVIFLTVITYPYTKTFFAGLSMNLRRFGALFLIVIILIWLIRIFREQDGNK